jgi:small-conductance mechanosensitive channel
MPLNAEHWSWLVSVGLVAGAVLAAITAHYALFALAERIARRTDSAAARALVEHGRRPAKAILPLLALLPVLPLLPLPAGVQAGLLRALTLGLIASLAWLAIALTAVLDDVVTARFRVEGAGSLQARKIRTQVQVLRRIAVALILVLALALMLMTFPSIRNVGASLFASAGVAGLIAGLAARPALTNLIAGLQLALTEPIRLEDQVIVEGEFGFVEEIGTTYVVVRTWDQRRLIVPLSYFIERPFQNWTRTPTNLLGTVFLYTDYSLPVEELRRELQRVLAGTDLWDGKTSVVHVTNLTERAMELRVLVGAADPSHLFDLRCHVREKLTEFLQARYPHCLPRMRAEVESRPPAATGS